MKEQYYGETIARSIMFSNNIDTFLKKIEKFFYVTDVNIAEILEVINETFIAYANSGFLTNNGKTNIYMYLHFLSRIELPKEAKDIYKLYYQELMDILNNDITDQKINDLYRIELAIRNSNKKYYSRRVVSDKKVEMIIPSINDSIEADFNVLFKHLDATEQEYEDSQIGFITSSTFVESARYLMYEWPGLMEESNFKNRLCSTLEKKEQASKHFRRNIFRLDKDDSYIGPVKFNSSDKRLYKQVSGM